MAGPMSAVASAGTACSDSREASTTALTFNGSGGYEVKQFGGPLVTTTSLGTGVFTLKNATFTYTTSEITIPTVRYEGTIASSFGAALREYGDVDNPTDVIFTSILDALDSLLDTRRLVATLRR